jgi:hypothetical protein
VLLFKTDLSPAHRSPDPSSHKICQHPHALLLLAHPSFIPLFIFCMISFESVFCILSSFEQCM